MIDVETITKYVLDHLDLKWRKVSFDKEFNLFYKGQTPTAAIVLVDGKVGIIKRNKSFTLIKPNEVAFLDELLKGRVLKNDIKVFANTTIYMIDRFSLFEDLQPNVYFNILS